MILDDKDFFFITVFLYVWGSRVSFMYLVWNDFIICNINDNGISYIVERYRVF